MIKKPRLTFILLVCFYFGSLSFSFCQPPGDPEGNPDPVPITGIEILIGLGGLLGVKKIINKVKGAKNS